ncbi:tetratricopeptide repeat protein [Marinobacter lacisalsi]|uniref:Tetratricopeptide repeat protein n=1 Tax=Marinobacter lacisalsi TaxID=475979 RepID=A0ABV8QMT8_9GAMM
MKTHLYCLIFAGLLGMSSFSSADAMRESVYDKLNSAKVLIEKGQLETASQKLGTLAGQKNLTTYERSQVLNLSGYLAIQQTDYPNAIRHYRALLALAEVPEGLQLSTQRNLAQLHYQTADWQKALTVLGNMPAESVSKDSQLLMLKAHSLFQLDRYRQAATVLEALDSRRSSEQALNLLRACYQQLKDHKGAIRVLEVLAERFPDTDYLKALASLYGTQGNYRYQLALLETLYTDGRLESESEWHALITLHLHQNQPGKAALRLREAIDRGILPVSDKNQFKLAQAWIQARETDKAIAILEELSGRTSNGESELMAGRLLLQYDQWKKAVPWLRKALDKTPSEDPEISLLLGIAELRSGQHIHARQSLQRAAHNPKTKERARQWLSYLDQISTPVTVLHE